MSKPLFPSGPWVGFYTYQNSTRRYLMDLNLRFQNGKINGDGADGLDTFVISGFYDVQKRECGWDKIYPTRSPVTYHGYRDGKGIWGGWTLSRFKGGFHIWPLTDGPPPDLNKREEEKEETIKEVIVRPLAIPVEQRQRFTCQ